VSNNAEVISQALQNKSKGILTQEEVSLLATAENWHRWCRYDMA